MSDAAGPPEPAEPAPPAEVDAAATARPPDDDRRRRPLIERIGMAAVAAVMASLFGGVAAAAWIGGEPFLAVMGGIGCLMTAWVGAITLFRG
jgi:hypothetical protein